MLVATTQPVRRYLWSVNFVVRYGEMSGDGSDEVAIVLFDFVGKFFPPKEAVVKASSFDFGVVGTVRGYVTIAAFTCNPTIVLLYR